MKYLSVALLVLSFNVFADHHEGKKSENFEEAKKHVLSNMDQRIQSLQEAKTCVSSATNRDAMKVCRSKIKEMNGSIKEGNKAWREERKSKRKK